MTTRRPISGPAGSTGHRRRSAARAAALGLALLLAAGCEGVYYELTIQLPFYREFAAGPVQAVLSEDSRVHLRPMPVERGLSAVDALSAGTAELALLENSATFVPGIRAVMPVFESVLHVMVRDGFVPAEPERPLVGSTIQVLNRSSAGLEFIRLLARRRGIAPDQYRLVDGYLSGEVDIILYLGPVDPDITNWFREGFRLVSMDNGADPGHGFLRDGIRFIVPRMRPVVIPPHTYFSVPGNQQALHTLAVDTLLVARKDVPVPVIYELTRTLVEEKPRLAALEPHLFDGINESFDPLELGFPLHTGARRYLLRDEPGLLERYAETINLLVYLAFLLLTGLVGFARWRGQRKKDRIDRFYVQVMGIRDSALHAPPAELLEELASLEREAFESLIAEKLAANESFRILTDQIERLRGELQQRGEPPI